MIEQLQEAARPMSRDQGGPDWRAISRAVLTDARQAINVQRLMEWAWARELVEMIELEDHAEAGWDGVSRVLDRVAELGDPKSGGRVYGHLVQVHPDALAVYGVAKRVLGPMSWRIVTHHARTESAPDWLPNLPPEEVVPERYHDGSRMRFRKRKDSAGRMKLVYTKRDNRVRIEGARLVYRRWYLSLRMIESALLTDDSCLSKWRLVRWPAKAKPWQNLG